VCLPLSERHKTLEILFARTTDALRLSPLLETPSGQILEAVRKFGLKGVVGKRLDSRFEPGGVIRGLDQAPHEHGAGVRDRWLHSRNARVRCVAPRHLREERTRLRRKGKNGFVPRVRDAIFPTLKALQTTNCPFENLPEKRSSRWSETITAEKMSECRWVEPKLACQVAFVEWTDGGHLHHGTPDGRREIQT
jgi:bifunctional non-homologous end joining protein LigD